MLLQVWLLLLDVRNSMSIDVLRRCPISQLRQKLRLQAERERVNAFLFLSARAATLLEPPKRSLSKTHLGGINEERAADMRRVALVAHADGGQNDALVGELVLCGFSRDAKVVPRAS